MKRPFSEVMQTATRHLRSGSPQRATDEIRNALRDHTSGAGMTGLLDSLAVGLPDQTFDPLRSGMPGLRGDTKPVDADLGRGFSSHSFSCDAGARDYGLYVPELSEAGPAGLVVMLHGCTQNPVDFAMGTGMNALADRRGFVVLYPGQSRGANMQTCWNWFSPRDQKRGAGEPAILAAMTAKIAADHSIPRDRVFVAGLSAGAAMAIILGRAYPEVFAAVGAHSGLPYASARDVQSAFAVMGGSAAQGSPRQSVAMPKRTIIFQGLGDKTVAPSNATRIAEDARAGVVGHHTEICDDGAVNGRAYRRTTVLDGHGSDLLELWQVEGLGHAWSGGAATGSYTDPSGPDASVEMIRFFLGED